MVGRRAACAAATGTDTSSANIVTDAPQACASPSAIRSADEIVSLWPHVRTARRARPTAVTDSAAATAATGGRRSAARDAADAAALRQPGIVGMVSGDWVHPYERLARLEASVGG